jgi:hypothetical protein
MDDSTFDEYAAFQRWMNRHLVSLVLINWHLDEAGKRNGHAHVAACSATVMASGDMWFLVTAGHVLQELDELIAHVRVEVAESFIVDSLGSQAKHVGNIPFNYADAARHYVFDDGLDYGLICLNANIRRLMAANGILPVDAENWINQDMDKCNGFVLLGIPRNSWKRRLIHLRSKSARSLLR